MRIGFPRALCRPLLLVGMVLVSCLPDQPQFCPRSELLQARHCSAIGDRSARRCYEGTRPRIPGSGEERQRTARELAEAYAARRVAAGFSADGAGSVETNTTVLANLPVAEADSRRVASERELVRASERQATAEIAALDSRPVTAADVTHIVRRRLAEDSAAASRGGVAVQEEVRQQILLRRQERAGQASIARERELARLAATNLADMPREIALGSGGEPSRRPIPL
jgi:hypothetical protein